MSAPHARLMADVVIADASLGGTVAAWRAAALGLRVLLVTRTPWLGGQFTSQAVPADEHAAIEYGGAPRSYLDFRARVRQRYMDQPTYRNRAAMTEGNNPGDGWVSRLCAEPPVLAAEFESLLAPYKASGLLRLVEATTYVAVRRTRDRIESLSVEETSGQQVELAATYFLDATDTGELLRLAGMSYRLGKEASVEFGESLAPDVSNRHDQQPVTWVMAIRWHPAPVAVAALRKTPAAYTTWRDATVPQYGHRQFSMDIPGARAGLTTRLPFSGEGATLDWWRYRRVVASHQWVGGREEVTLMNCAQNDYALHPLLDGPVPEHRVVEAARELSWCFLHWLRTEAPRVDATGRPQGHGYPELAPAPDMTGTPDGLAQQVYVRESRRMVTLTTLTEGDVLALDESCTPALRDDSVGCAWYNLDMHPTCVSGQGTNAPSRPFCLPLGSFVARDVANLLPASKNIGVTHLANACTRTHPTEWLIGEVSAHLAAYCIAERCAPAAVHESASRLRTLQHQLEVAGIPLKWRAEWRAATGPAHS